MVTQDLHEEEDFIKTVIGTYNHPNIITEDETIPARAYASKFNKWNNKFGVWNIKKCSNIPEFWVIYEFIEIVQQV